MQTVISANRTEKEHLFLAGKFCFHEHLLDESRRIKVSELCSRLKSLFQKRIPLLNNPFAGFIFQISTSEWI